MNLNLSKQYTQSGVILILALVILLILTMIVVGSMNTTNMQVLMTGNTQYHTQALNDAESALRFAENTISQFATNVANNKPGFYDLKTSNSQATNFSTFTWDNTSAATHTIGSRRSLYVIEYTGFTPGAGAPLGWRQGDPIIGDIYHLFRITARSTSARGAVRLVQTVYASQTGPQ